MKKLAVSNYENAIQQAKTFSKELADLIPQEINEIDKSVYHVLLVKKVHNQAQEKYEISGLMQTFGKGQAFEKISKNYQYHGFTALIIVHDPTKNSDSEQEPNVLKQHEKSSIKAQIEKEEKDAMEKRIAERLAQAENDKLAENSSTAGKAKGDTPTGDPTQGDGKANKGGENTPSGADAKNPTGDVIDPLVKYKKEVDMTVPELEDYAKTNKIDLTGKTLKGDIQLAIATELQKRESSK